MARLPQGRIKGMKGAHYDSPSCPFHQPIPEKRGISDAKIWRAHLAHQLPKCPVSRGTGEVHRVLPAPGDGWLTSAGLSQRHSPMHPLPTCLLDFQSVTSTGQFNHCKEAVTFYVGHREPGLHWESRLLLSPKLT